MDIHQKHVHFTEEQFATAFELVFEQYDLWAARFSRIGTPVPKSALPQYIPNNLNKNLVHLEFIFERIEHMRFQIKLKEPSIAPASFIATLLAKLDDLQIDRDSIDHRINKRLLDP